MSDVKSTEEILRYMKKSIPKNNFDQKSYKKFFEGIDIDVYKPLDTTKVKSNFNHFLQKNGRKIDGPITGVSRKKPQGVGFFFWACLILITKILFSPQSKKHKISALTKLDLNNYVL